MCATRIIFYHFCHFLCVQLMSFSGLFHFSCSLFAFSIEYWVLWMIALRTAMLQRNWCEYGVICLLLSSCHCSQLLGLCFGVYSWSVVWSCSFNGNVSIVLSSNGYFIWIWIFRSIFNFSKPIIHSNSCPTMRLIRINFMPFAWYSLLKFAYNTFVYSVQWDSGRNLIDRSILFIQSYKIIIETKSFNLKLPVWSYIFYEFF